VRYKTGFKRSKTVYFVIFCDNRDTADVGFELYLCWGIWHWPIFAGIVWVVLSVGLLVTNTRNFTKLTLQRWVPCPWFCCLYGRL